jgi:hypothetical protein
MSLVPAGAHLAELPHKIVMSGDEYLIVQQIYRGWDLFGIVIGGALLSMVALIVVLWRQAQRITLTSVALALTVAAQAVFWTFTFPVNQRTDNWTVLPSHWMDLRARWEYGHAVSAGFTLAALIVLIRSALDNAREQSLGARRS